MKRVRTLLIERQIDVKDVAVGTEYLAQMAFGDVLGEVLHHNLSKLSAHVGHKMKKKGP